MFLEKVNNILTTVVNELFIDRSKTFIYAEIGFFKKWWDI